MSKNGRETMFPRFAIMISVVVVMTTLGGSVRADHVEEGLGVLIGGIVGGTIGSAIGKGSGQKIAIGIGSALGALYGSEVSSHRRPSGNLVHQAYPGRWSHAPETVRYYPQPIPVYVHPVQPAAVHVMPSRVEEPSITVSSNIGGSTVVRRTPASITECRLLEGGLAPVYGCRDTHGQWRILR